MIVRVDSEAPVGSTASRRVWESYVSSPVAIKCAVFFAFFALVVALQIASGAFRSEFSAYPDEPAHYVTSLMLREYITGPNPIGPLHFAENYYHHYPKVAFGHWPPVFYIVQAFWMLLFSASRTSIRLEVAFTTAVLAFSFWSEARRWFGQGAALLGGFLLICLPLVQDSTDQEMAEILLTLFCFWSTLYFGRYLESGRLSDSLWFGVYFSLAVLTKGSGWLLVFIPPLAMLLTRRLQFLLKASFWFSVLLIALACLPWQVLTLRSAQRGWTGGTQPSSAYTLDSLIKFLNIIVAIAGPILFAVMVLGIITTVVIPLFTARVDIAPAVMFGLFFGDWLFHSLVPAGVEDRKMILAVPAMLFFLLAGGLWLADRLPIWKTAPVWRKRLVAVLGGVAFAVQAFAIPVDKHYGYTEAANFIVSHPQLQSSVILVSSESGGEGLLISELAMREPRPRDVVMRATKVLAKVDWTGSDYKLLFTNTSEVLKFLAQNHVGLLVTDNYPSSLHFGHQPLIEKMIRQNPDLFHLQATFSDRNTYSSGAIRIYSVEIPSAER